MGLKLSVLAISLDGNTVETMTIAQFMSRVEVHAIAIGYSDADGADEAKACYQVLMQHYAAKYYDTVYYFHPSGWNKIESYEQG